MADGADEKRVAEADQAENLRFELRRIALWPAVVSDSLAALRKADGRLVLRFDIRTEAFAEAGEARIRDVEPIALIYPSVEQVGSSAPSVWSGRADFPRDIGHINATPLGEPASLCLARAGLQPIYDRHGIDGVVHQLSEWLRDAKAGALMVDGWEPVPIGEGQKTRGAYLNLGAFQDLAMVRAPQGGNCMGVAKLLDKRLNHSVAIFEDVVDSSDKKKVAAAKAQIANAPKEPITAAYVPWVFVWPDASKPISDQVFGTWNTLGELFQGLKGAGLDTPIQTAMMQALLALGDTPDRTGGKTLVLLVGLWRPKPIIADVFGLSKDANARRLEVRGYVLQRPLNNKNPVDDKIPVLQAMNLQLPSRQMLSFTSGIDDLGRAAVLGYGALGSAVSDFLARSGIQRLLVVDDDIFAPHNIARHNGTVNDVFATKVRMLRDVSAGLTTPPGEIECATLEKDVLKLSPGEITDLTRDSRAVIDATADERVRRHLSKHRPAIANALLRIEIFDRGRLGALFVSSAGNDLTAIDLYYELCARAVNDDSVFGWLRREAQAGLLADELLVGLGCASATTRMPKHTVVQHASAAMPAIVSALQGEVSSGIGINPLSETGTPLGWRWFAVSPRIVSPREGNVGWSVRMSQDVQTNLDHWREAAGVNETGGYLYGAFDHVLREIYVVAASDLPPGSEASATSLRLGPAGRTAIERRLLRRAPRKLARVGTWHSHPQSGPEMSSKDRKTMDGFYPSDQKQGIPTLLVITSPNGTRMHLRT